MARGKKTSSEKIVEVLTAKLINPDLSTRDIAQETGVPKSTVSRTIDEDMGQIGAKEKKDELFDCNLDIIRIGSAKIKLAMERLNPETIRDTKEYQTIVDTAFKQNQLLQGKSTENVSIVDGADILRKIQNGTLGVDNAYELLRATKE